MAMVNVAEILADAGYDVIACDWDLEAPGLERYLAESREEADQAKQNPGIIDLLVDYKQRLSRPEHAAPDEADRDIREVNGLRLRRPSSWARPVGSRSHPSGGSLRLLGAGRRDGAWNERYTAAVRDFDWGEFYAAWAGDAYLDFFREDLADSCDIVLVDSRTGVTEHGGICTHHLADLVVLLSAANDLNLEGTLWMARVLGEDRVLRMRQGRRLHVFPVAARIEQLSETTLLVDFKARFVKEFA